MKVGYITMMTELPLSPIGELKNSAFMRNLSTDLYDKFVDWIRERFDLKSFIDSKMSFKKEQLEKFIKGCSDDDLQYKMEIE